MKIRSSFRRGTLPVIAALGCVALVSSACWWDQADAEVVSIDRFETVEDDVVALVVEDLECLEFGDVEVDESADEIVITASMYQPGDDQPLVRCRELAIRGPSAGGSSDSCSSVRGSRLAALVSTG